MLRHLAMAAAMLTALSGSAYAQARPDTRTMTCAQVQAMLQRQGAVTMTTGAHTFDRFAADRRFCGGAFGGTPQASTVPTRDNSRCPVVRCVHEPRQTP